MKLLFFYSSEIGPLGESGINLDSNWAFSYERRTDHQIHVSYRDVIGTDFFALPENKGRVDSVSAIVGENGAGKTSVAAALSVVYRNVEIVRLYKYRGRYHRYCAVIEVDGKLILCRNYPVQICQADVDVLPLKVRGLFDGSCFDAFTKRAYPELMDHVACLYYSPMMTSERVVFGASDRRYLDASATDALVRSGSWESYRNKERLSVINFLAKYRDRLDELDFLSGVSLPVHAILSGPGHSAVINTALVAAAVDDRIVRLMKLCEASEGFARAIVRVVSKVAKWESLLPKRSEGGCLREYHRLGARFLECFLKLYDDLGWSIEDRESESLVHNERTGVEKYCGYRTCCEDLLKLGQELNDLSFHDVAVACETDIEFAFDEYKRGIELLLQAIDLLRDRENQIAAGGICCCLQDKNNILSLSNIIKRADEYDLGEAFTLYFDPPISSGEMSYLSMYARLDQGLPESGNQIVFLDEVETTLHPQLQTEIVSRTIAFLSFARPSLKCHVIFASHSPMLLSDIPLENVVFLKDGRQVEVKQKTFASNIFDLYKESFFMQGGTLGAFATMKVNVLLNKLRPQYEAEQDGVVVEKQGGEPHVLSRADLQTARLIGDPFLSKFLWHKIGYADDEIAHNPQEGLEDA